MSPRFPSASIRPPSSLNVFLIMAPIYARTHDANQAWHAGNLCQLIERHRADGGGNMRRLASPQHASRRSAGSFGRACPGLSLPGLYLRCFSAGGDCASAMLILFTLYGSHLSSCRTACRRDFLPSGSGPCWWRCCAGSNIATVPIPVVPAPQLYLPHTVNLFALFNQHEYWSYLAIIVPLAVLDTLASLMILESAKVAGDDYPPCRLCDEWSGHHGRCFAWASPFPRPFTWATRRTKANGARSGYSVLNGVSRWCFAHGILPWCSASCL